MPNQGTQDDLQCWVYVSQSILSAGSADAEAASIVELSQKRNATLNVTGALIFPAGRFAQLIEGPEASIVTLRASIEHDARHKDVTTLFWGRRGPRLFEGWSLIYSGDFGYMAKPVRDVRLGSTEGPAAGAGAVLRMFSQLAQDVALA